MMIIPESIVGFIFTFIHSMVYLLFFFSFKQFRYHFLDSGELSWGICIVCRVQPEISFSTLVFVSFQLSCFNHCNEWLTVTVWHKGELYALAHLHCFKLHLLSSERITVQYWNKYKQQLNPYYPIIIQYWL